MATNNSLSRLDKSPIMRFFAQLSHSTFRLRENSKFLKEVNINLKAVIESCGRIAEQEF